MALSPRNHPHFDLYHYQVSRLSNAGDEITIGWKCLLSLTLCLGYSPHSYANVYLKFFFFSLKRLIFFHIIICRIGINRTFIYICIYIFIVVEVIIFFIILIDVFQSRGCIFYLVNQLKEFEARKVFEKIIIIINFFDKRHFLIRENLLVNKK